MDFISPSAIRAVGGLGVVGGFPSSKTPIKKCGRKNTGRGVDPESHRMKAGAWPTLEILGGGEDLYRIHPGRGETVCWCF